MSALPTLRWDLAVLIAGLALGGCQSKDSSDPKGVPNAAQGPSSLEKPTKEQSPAASQPVVGDKTIVKPPPSRPDLETVMWKIRCLLDSKKRKGALAIYEKHGFRDASDWADQWSRASQDDPDWAERSLVSVLNRGCPPPD